jgi:hypothetical protein
VFEGEGGLYRVQMVCACDRRDVRVSARKRYGGGEKWLKKYIKTFRLAFECEGGLYRARMECACDRRDVRVSAWPSALGKVVVGVKNG